jgi:hypothetical protein
MRAESTSWKQKIDPAFDRIVKFYLNIFEHLGLPTNSGWIVYDERIIKVWQEKKSPVWLEPYEKDVIGLSKDILKSFFLKKGITEKERQKHRREYYKWLAETVKILPEDSQQYYLKLVEPYYTDDPAVKLGDDLTPVERFKRVMDLFGDIFPLSLHEIIHEVTTEIKNLENQDQDVPKKYLHPKIMLPIIAAMNNTICLLVFEKGILLLLKEAREGNRESFFKLLQVDRSVMGCDWALKMIRKAQLEADETFFNEMAKAIVTSPLENTKIYGKAILILLYFWDMGLKKLSYREMIELLEDCGVSLQDDVETFSKFVRRLRAIYRSYPISL